MLALDGKKQKAGDVVSLSSSLLSQLENRITETSIMDVKIFLIIMFYKLFMREIYHLAKVPSLNTVLLHDTLNRLHDSHNPG